MSYPVLVVWKVNEQNPHFWVKAHVGREVIFITAEIDRNMHVPAFEPDLVKKNGSDHYDDCADYEGFPHIVKIEVL